MTLPAHRILSLEEADKELGLAAAWESAPWAEGDDELFDTFSEDARVLVFDGDTRLESFPDYRIVAVKGNLEVAFLHTFDIKALFVFGNLICEKAKFYKHNLVWVQGDLVARTAVLGLSDQDDAMHAAQDGAFTVRVQGKASAPHVRSWWMGLSHLKWTPESGKEFCEEIELPDSEDHLSDPVWKNSL